ncbi:Putative gamma-glutamylcyclotransferase YkqA [Burkholderia lata]|uniref:gamma-glutamylcyclotransferase family protein n=1 Tax=Burkholderia lata (strain ATCC 17760 / DSM 23089 / LMG 22485 / NCIMB 9086 / R18194 / 383) TaxID=482957 RepID=UPI0014534013|nr:gamma-glutamylcyclotransferase family protein [Burkholderia lata]VWB26351.1 Putative gamma-glutamylcyclotransferase YkqA [Burkholderia lata]
MTADDLLHGEHFTYFAYGSCMNRASLSASLGCDATPYFEGAARLDGHRLAFNYASLNEPVCCANIEPAAGSIVEGALYRLPVRMLDALERREGVHLGRYVRCAVEVRESGGLRVRALTYRGAVTLDCEAAPSARYRDLLVRGLTDAGVSAAYRDRTVAYMAGLRDRPPEMQ